MHQLNNIILFFTLPHTGLTCTEQNFIGKGGAQRLAAEYGFIVVNPDTSPRKYNYVDEKS